MAVKLRLSSQYARQWRAERPADGKRVERRLAKKYLVDQFVAGEEQKHSILTYHIVFGEYSLPHEKNSMIFLRPKFKELKFSAMRMQWKNSTTEWYATCFSMYLQHRLIETLVNLPQCIFWVIFSPELVLWMCLLPFINVVPANSFKILSEFRHSLGASSNRTSTYCFI